MEYQITGHGDIKHLAVTLNPGDEIYIEKGSLIYHERGIDMVVSFNGRGIKRILGAKLSGESLLILNMKNVSDCPRRLAVAASCGMFAIELADETLLCRPGAYKASLDKVTVNAKFSIKGLVGGLGAFMQKITGSTTIFLETKGNPIEMTLAEDDILVMNEDHVIAMRGITLDRINPRWSAKNVLAGAGFSLLEIKGPGTVYVSPASFLNLSEVFGNSL